MGWFSGVGRRPDWQQALEQGFAPAREVDATLTDAVLNFVVFGDASGVGGHPASITDAQKFPGWSSRLVRGAPARRGFYERIGSVPPDVVGRLATVLEVTRKARAWYPGFPPIAGDHRAEALLADIGRTFGKAQPPMGVAVIEQALGTVGVPAGDLLIGLFAEPTSSYADTTAAEALARIGDYPEAVAWYRDRLLPGLSVSSVAGRLHVLTMLAPLNGDQLGAFAEPLVAAATATSQQVRREADPLLRRIPAAVATPELQRIATSGKPDQRVIALRLLWDVADEVGRASLRAMAADDKAASVRSLVEQWSAPLPHVDLPETFVIQEPPPTEWRTWNAEVEAAVVGEFLGTIDKAIATGNRHRERLRADAAARGERVESWMKRVEQGISGSLIGSARRVMSEGRPPSQVTAPFLRGHVHQGLQAIAGDPRLPAAALFQLVVMFGEPLDVTGAIEYSAASALNTHHRSTGRPTLLELERMLDEVGCDGAAAVAESYFRGWIPIGDDWRPEAVWPFFAKHLDALLGRQRGKASRSDEPLRVFTALGTFPQPPRQAVEALYAWAIGPSKTFRRPAQDALARDPGRVERACAALADGKADVRTEAAAWLGRIKDPAAIPALEAAISKEKSDLAKGAMLDALTLLGRPVEEFLGRATLDQTAATAIARGLSRELDWVRWEALPPVTWADSGERVPVVVLQWLANLAVRAKSPEPNAILRHYCALFEAASREALGQAVLEAWLAQDLKPIPADEAQQQASQRAASFQRWATGSPDGPMARYVGKSVEEIAAMLLPDIARQPGGSAIGSKGLLALAAACAGRSAVPPVERYLKEWYGLRAAQGKALIGMLAWIDHPSAIQLMLAVGSRFRTKGLQVEAAAQAQALAERRGWTVAELADRSIPTAGFDADGTLELSYGARTFTARVQPDLTLTLHDPGGKQIKSLPAPRVSDDPDSAASAKKDLGATRKELGGIAALQSVRLYEAMCTSRGWPAADWQQFLQLHPLLRHLVQRLVWIATPASGDGHRTFRPLDDGTLTDVEDNEVTLSADSIVMVAHGTHLSADEVTAWNGHLTDYEVESLFTQFGPTPYQLVAGTGTRSAITDFTGHLIEAYTLRARATKLGYQRTQAEDAGWFYGYRKNFPTLQLAATIGFTGNPLPEENRTVALTELTFAATSSQGEETRITLDRVPPILLSESVNDLRTIASAGSGFDPHWESKTEF